MAVKKSMLGFWVVRLRGLTGRYQDLEGHTTPNFRTPSTNRGTADLNGEDLHV
jgi:hypothetical protein